MEVPVECILLGLALHVVELAGLITILIKEVCDDDR